MNASLSVMRLSKKAGVRTLLEDISFEASKGECLAVFGPNGAGKTTLLHLLAGLSRPTSGELRWQNRPVREAAAGYRAGIGLVGHETFLYDDLTAEENLLFFQLLMERHAGPGQSAVEGKDTVHPGEALSRAGLQSFAQDRVRHFSRGMRQRLTLARVWLQSPQLLLLDEPYTGLDEAGSRWLSSMIGEWRQQGKTIVISLHDIEQGLAVSDRYLLLRGGRLAGQGASGAAKAAVLREKLLRSST